MEKPEACIQRSFIQGSFEHVSRTHFGVHEHFLSVLWVLSSICRPLVSVHRALLSVSGPLLDGNRFLLSNYKVIQSLQKKT